MFDFCLTINSSGMWGTKLLTEQHRQSWRDAWQEILEDELITKHGYDADQQLLARRVWTWAREDMMTHASYW